MQWKRSGKVPFPSTSENFNQNKGGKAKYAKPLAFFKKKGENK